jgi:hypothetical protein
MAVLLYDIANCRAIYGDSYKKCIWQRLTCWSAALPQNTTPGLALQE